MFLYVVKPNDTLYKLSIKYQVNINNLIRDNGISDPSKLAVGQCLIIRASNFTYVVKKGDSLYQISVRTGVPVAQILKYNPNIKDPSSIQVGDEIKIVYDNENKVPKEINGYAYPTINREVLAKTLPHLTYITIFSYHIKSDGSIVNINDEDIIESARKMRVAPLMSITNIGEKGTFNSDLAHEILSSPTLQDKLLDNIIENAKRKNYYGVNFDFEYVYPEDRENYNNFLEKASKRLNEEKLLMVTAIAPKYRANQKGLLYEAHDYPVHGKFADRVVIMTYEWGYTYGPALPVAPINRVMDVIDYAVTAIPSKKILMGIPNYGYDFKVPHVEGQAADSVSNNEAVDIAIRVGAEIKYDEEAQTPYFDYVEGTQKHRVYFEDPRSIAAKIQLAIEFQLGGLNYWTLKDFFPQNWVLVDYYLNVIKKI
jgi:spore germination protein